MGPLGYSETMSNGAPLSHIFGFAAASAVLLAACWLIDLRTADRVLLAAMVAATLFLGLKAAGVRTHDMTGASALMVVAAVIVLLATRPRWLAPLLGVVVVAASWHPIASLVGLTGSRLAHAPAAVAERIVTPGHLDRRYADAVADIRRHQLMPRASSDSDVYAIAQSDLLAQGVDWNPRPVIQSYAAYTPGLAELNRKHLTGPDAPENVYFSFSSIDGRLPTLEDGPSLMPLAGLYQLTRFDPTTRYVVLHRRASPEPVRRGKVRTLHAELGEPIEIPPTRSGWVASFEIEKTLIGRVRSTLWRPPMMKIELTLSNGSKPVWRFVPAMARSEFLLSPYVPTTAHLAGLLGRSKVAG